MNKEDLSFWKFVFDIAQLAITVGIAIYVWILSKHKVNATKIAKLEDAHNAELNSVKTRLTEVETTVKYLPNRTQISRIHKRIDELSQGVHAMEGELKGVTDNTAMILQALIKKGENK